MKAVFVKGRKTKPGVVENERWVGLVFKIRKLIQAALTAGQ
jgi:hypothetical protein